MIPRLVVVLGWFLGSLLASSTILSICDYRLVHSRQFRATALDVEVDGNDLWLTTAYGIELHTRAVDPPAMIASLALPGTTTTLAPAGQFAYVGSGSSLMVVSRGNDLHVISQLDLGDVVHDLLLSGRYLYAATSSGVVQVDIFNPEQPAMASRLTTTTGAALSVARIGSFLYAADGDASIEVFTLQVPELAQKIGTVASLPRTVAVHASGSNLYATDGQQTDVFSGSGASLGRIDNLPVGTVAFHPRSAETLAVAGLDRRLRIFDRVSRSVVFDISLPVTSGNVNRVTALSGSDDVLYVAAGDLGLVTFDLSGFDAPYLMQSYSLGGVRSVVESGSSVFVSFDAGGLRQFRRESSGALTEQRRWDEGRTSVVHEATAANLLTSSGVTLVLWDLSGASPAAIATATFPSMIRSAVLRGQIAHAVLGDRTLWRADLSQPVAAIAPVDARGARPHFISQGGLAIALADLEDNGTTTIRYFAIGDFTADPTIVSIEGAATSGITVSPEGAGAAATFRGVSLIDFGGGLTALLPDTNTATRDLHISGDDLYVLTPAKLQIWGVSSRQLKREIELASEAFAVHHSADEATIATAEGLATVDPLTQSRQPEQISNLLPNSYHREIVLGGDYVYLFDGRNIDIHLILKSGVAILQRRVSFPGALVDIAASTDGFFTLSSGGKATAFGRDGVAGAVFQISEGEGAQPLSMKFVAGALYISISHGCPGACEKKTLIVDPRSMTQASSLIGGLVDAVADQGIAYALFDQPKEIRILNVADPYRPSITASRPSEGDPVSVAATAQTVYTLGAKLYAYSLPSLSKIGEQLANYTDPTGRLSYFDQTVRVLGADCSVIAGRTGTAELQQILNANIWTPSTTPGVPSVVRSMTFRDGMLFLLTDHSLEVWSSMPPPPRSRTVRR